MIKQKLVCFAPDDIRKLTFRFRPDMPVSSVIQKQTCSNRLLSVIRGQFTFSESRHAILLKDQGCRY